MADHWYSSYNYIKHVSVIAILSTIFSKTIYIIYIYMLIYITLRKTM